VGQNHRINHIDACDAGYARAFRRRHILIRGPLQHQADALMKLREAMANLEGASVDLGIIAVR
jgi:hypothetical protein